MKPECNLAWKPWVPVISEGRSREASLYRVLGDAEGLNDLDWSSPLDAAAVLGLLVALVKDIYGLMTHAEFAELWRKGSFGKQELDRYFGEHGGAFELFAPDRPFFQVGNAQAVSGETKSVAIIMLEQSAGNNAPIFASSTESGMKPLRPGDAARRLVALHAWDTAGIKTGLRDDPQVGQGKTTGNPTGPLGQLGLITLIGRNLFETLLLNTPIGGTADDRPAWRNAQRVEIGTKWRHGSPLGVMDRYTWQSRRVLLFPEVVDGNVVVGRVLVGGGDRMNSTPKFEFRTAWKREKASKGGVELRPRRLRAGQSGWRGLAALLARSDAATDATPIAGVLVQASELYDLLPEDYPMEVQLGGVEYGNNAAVIEHVISDRTPLPSRALNSDSGVGTRNLLEQMATQADDVSTALNRLGNNLRRAAGGEKVPWDKGQRLGDVFLAGLEPNAHRVLRGLCAEPDKSIEAGLAWEQLLRTRATQVAVAQFDHVPPQAFLGHGEEGKEGRMRGQTAEAFFWKALNAALPSTKSGLVPGQIESERAS